jgi:putative two-component system response regulator
MPLNVSPLPLALAPRDKIAAVPETQKIVIVDDEPFNLMVLAKHLRNAGFANIATISDARAAVSQIVADPPGILLLDVVMPHVSGLDILRRLRPTERSDFFPVLILTAASDSETKRTALELGATDFLPKPVDPHELVPRVRNALVMKAYQDRLKDHAEELERQVAARTAELEASRREVVHCLARAAEYRDDVTGRHVVRVGRYAGVIARKLGIGEKQSDVIELAAQLHDVGKIGIPDSILNAPGKLDPEQFAMMQRHCAYAKNILTPLSDRETRSLQAHAHLGAELLNVSSSPMLVVAARIAQTHHEHWDGSGYPLGLAGEEIPLEGRIVAVADVFDALSSPRSYKEAFPREQCFQLLDERRGTQFDPQVLDAFVASRDEIARTQIEFMDAV